VTSNPFFVFASLGHVDGIMRMLRLDNQQGGLTEMNINMTRFVVENGVCI
jgi:hypothetical protein